MRLFGSKPGVTDLQNHLATLSERLNQLESDQRRLELDYLETYDKVKRLMSRVAKRAALDSPTEPDAAPALDDRWSHLDPISADIMRRRANGVR